MQIYKDAALCALYNPIKTEEHTIKQKTLVFFSNITHIFFYICLPSSAVCIAPS